MLQQTQAQRVIPKWRVVLRRLPDAGGVRGRSARRRAAAVAGPRLPAPRPATCIWPRWRSRPSTAGRFQTISRPCSRCRASGRTRPGRCSRSRTSATWLWSTPTSPACSPARWASGSPRPPRSDSPIATCPHGTGGSGTRSLMDLGASVCRPSPRCDALSARRDVRLESRRTASSPTRPSDRLVSARDRRRTRAPTVRRVARSSAPWHPVPFRRAAVPRRHRRLPGRRRPRRRACRPAQLPVIVALWSPNSAITPGRDVTKAPIGSQPAVIAATMSSNAASA